MGGLLAARGRQEWAHFLGEHTGQADLGGDVSEAHFDDGGFGLRRVEEVKLSVMWRLGAAQERWRGKKRFWCFNK